MHQTSLFALSPFVIKIKAKCRIHFTSGKLAKNQNILARVQQIRPSIHVSLQRTALCKVPRCLQLAQVTSIACYQGDLIETRTQLTIEELH